MINIGKEKMLDLLVSDDDIDVEMMYYIACRCKFANEYYTDYIYSHEYLKTVLINLIKKDYCCCIELLRSVEKNSALYLFDYSCYGNGADIIETKKDLKNILLTGTY